MPVELPESLARRMPSGLRLRALEAFVPLKAAGPLGQLVLLRDAAGLHVVAEPPGDAGFRELTLVGTPGLRLHGAALLLEVDSGQQVVSLPEWLDQELVRDFLAELPRSKPVDLWLDDARLLLAQLLLSPHAQLLELCIQRLPSHGEAAMPLDIRRIQAELSTATTAEIVELVEVLRLAWKLPSPAGVAPGSRTYSVVLAPFTGSDKIAAIHALRQHTDAALGDAKHLVEQGGVALQGADAAKARALEAALAAAGCTVEVKGG